MSCDGVELNINISVAYLDTVGTLEQMKHYFRKIFIGIQKIYSTLN